jgi:hypothetical protein
MAPKSLKKSQYKYYCDLCDYGCTQKNDFNKHINTKKHNAPKSKKMLQENHIFTCHCGKEYKHRQSFNRHKRTCNYEKNNEIKIDKKEEENYKELLHSVIKQNTELQKTITDLIPKIGNTTNSNNNINQKFNINVFLNEECKDALTMEQFIDKIEVTMGNLLLTKNKGIDEGISNIFIENMSKLSLYERPMHCTDTKRDTIYIKSEVENGDEGQWTKDTDKDKIKRAIKRIESKQHKNLGIWMEEHPGWEEDASLQEEYLDLMRSCTKDVKDQKIIKNVCNVVKID